MLHAYVERFDVMGERENILGWHASEHTLYVGGLERLQQMVWLGRDNHGL
jgi:hypothetical protein